MHQKFALQMIMSGILLLLSLASTFAFSAPSDDGEELIGMTPAEIKEDMDMFPLEPKPELEVHTYLNNSLVKISFPTHSLVDPGNDTMVYSFYFFRELDDEWILYQYIETTSSQVYTLVNIVTDEEEQSTWVVALVRDDHGYANNTAQALINVIRAPFTIVTKLIFGLEGYAVNLTVKNVVDNTRTLIVYWGDETQSRLSVPTGEKIISHIYKDDGDYNITVVDEASGYTRKALAHIDNVLPKFKGDLDVRLMLEGKSVYEGCRYDDEEEQVVVEMENGMILSFPADLSVDEPIKAQGQAVKDKEPGIFGNAFEKMASFVSRHPIITAATAAMAVVITVVVLTRW